MAGKKALLIPRSTAQADDDLAYWQSSGNQKILDRINKLILDSLKDPSSGIGKPELLRFQSIPTYSRRIDRKHRLIYRIEGNLLIILSARFHYTDK